MGSNQFQDRVVCKACGKVLFVVFPDEVDERVLSSTKWAERWMEKHRAEVAKLQEEKDNLTTLLEAAERKLEDVSSTSATERHRCMIQ